MCGRLKRRLGGNMAQPTNSGVGTAPVAILLSPRLAAVADVFRAMGDFETLCDVAVLDRLEGSLAARMSPQGARGLLLDALLLAFALRRSRPAPFAYAPVGSRRSTRDEYRLLALVAAAYWRDPDLARKAVAALDAFPGEALISLAYDVARWLRTADLHIEPACAELLDSEKVRVAASPGEAGFRSLRGGRA